MKKTLVSVIVGAALGIVFVAGGTEANASEADGVWTPRTVDQIKADIAKAKDNKYKIVWGDTLSGISQATNLTVRKLADLNKIANVDLIYAGNTLVFEGNVVSVEDDKGETVAQTVIRPQDKNDAKKPVGKQEPAKETTDKAKGTAPVQKDQGTTTTTGKTDTSNQGTVGSQSGTTSTENGTATSTSQTETPAPTTSSSVEQPGDNQPTQPSQPAEKPTTPTQPSTGGEQGGTTTVPVTDPSTVTDQEPMPGTLGNSGKVFNSESEAKAYGKAEATNPDSKWYGYEWQWFDLVNKNYEPIGKWTVNFNQ